MSLETMLAVLEDELSADENKVIQPLTETPAKVYTPKNLTDAEDEIKDKDKEEKDKDEEYREEHEEDDEEEGVDTDDYDVVSPDETVDSIGDENTSDEDIDSKLMKLTTYQLLTTQFLKLEYGTPSGSDSGICPSCGSEDAADAAIIDNEISGAERTEPFGSTDNNGGGFGGSGGDFGGGFGDSEGGEGGEDDFGSDFSFYYKQRVALEHCVPGTENFVRTFTGLFEFGEKIFHTVAKHATRVIRAALRVAEHNLVKVRYMAKFYQFKLTKLINFIDDEALAKVNVEAWPADDWTKIKEGCSEVFGLCKDIENQLAAEPGKFKGIKEKYEKAYKAINVNIDVQESKNNTHELFKLRKGGTLAELNYGKDNVVRMFRQLEELGEIVGTSAMSEITVSLKKAALHIKTETTKLKGLQAAKPGDAKLKKEMDLLQAYNLRYNFLANCVNTYVAITDRLTDDLYRVSKAFETSIVPEYVR